jgi:hypothetical protein
MNSLLGSSGSQTLISLVPVQMQAKFQIAIKDLKTTGATRGSGRYSGEV